MWKTTNYNGEQVWYSKEEYKLLQQENEELKEKIKDLDAMTGIFSVRLANKYKQALEEIRKLINETCWDYTDISIIPVKEKILDKINEVLND